MNNTYTSLRFLAILCTFLFSLPLSAQFITTWETTSDNESITIPTFLGADYNYNVDWGDTTLEIGLTGDATHEYDSKGTYTVKITGTFPRIYFNNTADSKDKILEINQWGNNAWTSMNHAFDGCSNLISTATDTPNLTDVTDMSYMFQSATSFNTNLSDWDVSGVAYMNNMFSGASLFNADLSGWDVSNVIYMYDMFSAATSFDQDLSSWDVSNVTLMFYMFTGVTLSTANYNALLDSWGKQNVKNDIAFSGGNSQYCYLGEKGKNALIAKGWKITDGGKDTDANCDTLKFITTWETTSDNESITIPTYSDEVYADGETYDYTVDWGDTTPEETGLTGNATHEYASKGTYTVKITGLFPRIYFNFTGDRYKILEIARWGNMVWTSMDNAFMGCTKLDITATDTPNLANVTSMRWMFAGAEAFNGDLSSWNVSNVTDMSYMFRSATSYDGDLSNWDVRHVTDMRFMFWGAISFDQDLSGWIVNGVTDMSNMFRDANSFDQDLSSWNVSNVTNMSYMFDGATAFDQDLSKWDVSNVSYMDNMFKNVTLSTAHYDALLESWGKQNVQDNVTFDGGSSKYCDLGETGRNALIAKNWTITDGGKDTSAHCGTLSVLEHSTMPWVVSPNPTTAVLHISGSVPVQRVQVFSIDGKKQLEQTDTRSISLESIEQGVYLVKLHGTDKQAHTFKVIKQ